MNPIKEKTMKPRKTAAVALGATLIVGAAACSTPEPSTSPAGSSPSSLWWP